MSTNAHHAVVIGAGIAGCVTAYRLALAGYQVSLLEQEASIAQQASGNLAAVIYPRLSDESSPIDQYALAAFQHTLQLLKSLPNAKDAFHACGLLQLAINAREEKRIKKVAARAFDGFAVELLPPDNATQLAGVRIDKTALYFSGAGYVLPQALCHTLIQQSNIQLLPNTKASHLIPNGDGWLIKTQQDSIRADVVVICNAHDAAKFSQTAYLQMETVRGQMSMVSSTEASQTLKSVLCGDGYITPAIDDAHCIGATFTPNSLDLSLSEVDNQHNCEMVQTLSDDFVQLNKITHARAALRTTTADYLPLIGPILNAKVLQDNQPKHLSPTPALPFHKGLFVNIAHGSRGFTSAPLGAELIMQYLRPDMNASMVLLDACQPNRFLLREMGLKRLNLHVAQQALSSLA